MSSKGLKYFFCICVTFLIFSACGGDSEESQDESVQTSNDQSNPPAINTSAKCGPGLVYPEQATSPYILPYPVGQSYNIGQGNCNSEGHFGVESFAYDFDMPIGTGIIASRSGVVVEVVEEFFDSTRDPDQTNFIVIEHSDGTIAGYYHLTINGALVELGEQVSQGQLIALSGDSGDSSEPHLHLEVLACRDCQTIPISFSNSGTTPNGLMQDVSYVAQPF